MDSANVDYDDVFASECRADFALSEETPAQVTTPELPQKWCNSCLTVGLLLTRVQMSFMPQEKVQMLQRAAMFTMREVWYAESVAKKLIGDLSH